MTAESNPYVGLRPFDTDDSHLFFGRSDQITSLLESLYHHRFLGVVGSSGCGKSSLIKAGLLPALPGGFLIANREKWVVASFTPGDSPLDNLASALRRAFTGEPYGDPRTLRREIQSDGIAAVCDRLLGSLSPEMNLLLLVDQFEEIFAFRGRAADGGEDSLDATRRRALIQRRADAAEFVQLLLTLSHRPKAAIYVVATMRSDFLGDCDIFYGLPEAMNRGRYLVPRLSRKQLAEAIVGPARFGGAEIAKPLVDRLLNELGDRFDRLPVLQHALRRTWVEWRKNPRGPVVVKHYEDAGMLEGALAKHAVEVLADLCPAGRGITTTEKARIAAADPEIASVFQSLADTDAAGRQVRRPARLGQIAKETGLSKERIQAIAKPFLDAGFLYSASELADDGSIEPRYSLSHESLIRQWDTLHGWVTAERESRDNYRELVALAAGEARRERGLLRDPDLQFKRRWWEQKAPRRAWAARYVERQEAFDSAAGYLGRSVLWQRIRRTAVIASVVIVLLSMGGLAAWALTQRNQARANAAAAEQSAEEAKRSAERERRSAEQAEKSAEEARKNQALAEAQAQALANLELTQKNLEIAKKNEENARLALEEVSKRTAELNTKFADITRAREEAERNLQEAIRTREQKAKETEIADIFARIDPSDPVALRDGLWKLAMAPDDVTEQVLRRLLSSDPASQRLFAAGDSVVAALLGAQPSARIQIVSRVVGDTCLDRFRDVMQARAVLSTCSLLIRELGVEGAADPDIERRAMIAIEAAVNPRDDAFVLAFNNLGSALGPDNVARLAGTLLKAPTPLYAPRVVSRLAFLATFGDRLREPQARQIVDQLVEDLLRRPSPLDNPSDYEFGEAHLLALRARLDEATQRRLVDRVLSSLGAIRDDVPIDSRRFVNAYQGRFLSFFASQLTASEGATAGRALLAGIDPASPGSGSEGVYGDLKRLGENLATSARPPYAAELMKWTGDTYLPAKSPSYTVAGPAEALYAVRASLDAPSVRALSAKLVTTATDDRALTRLQILAAIGGADALSQLNRPQLEALLQRVPAPFLERAVVPFSNRGPRSTPLDRELVSSLRLTVLNPAVLFTRATPDNPELDTRLTASLIEGLTASELTTFLNQVPNTSDASRIISRQLSGMGEERGGELVQWLSRRANNTTNLSDLADVTRNVNYYLERFPNSRHDLSGLVEQWMRALTDNNEGNRFSASLALADLAPKLTDTQANAIVRALATRIETASEFETALLARFGPTLDTAVAGRLVAVLWKQFTADTDFRKDQAARALARVGRHLDGGQKQAALARLLTAERGVASLETQESLIALVPALDSQQIEAVRSAVEQAVRGTNSLVEPRLVATLADRLDGDRRRDTMQLIIEPFEQSDRRNNSLEELQALVPVIEKFDVAQRERILRVVTSALRMGFRRSSQTAPALASFSGMLPGARTRIITALNQTLEVSSQTMTPEDVLLTVSELTRTPVSLQQLWDLLKWPTLAKGAYVGIVQEIARREKLTDDSLLRPAVSRSPIRYAPIMVFNAIPGEDVEPDRWALSAWATKRGLNLAPVPPPAGYE